MPTYRVTIYELGYRYKDFEANSEEEAEDLAADDDWDNSWKPSLALEGDYGIDHTVLITNSEESS